MYRGDKVLHAVDLTKSEPKLLEVPVARWFGRDDMYKDVADTIKSRKDVEEELSKLESRASAIIRSMTKAQENSDPNVWLTRTQRNELRKFLFIMKYRGPSYYRKYTIEQPHSYDSDDKDDVWTYMLEKKLQKPRDVWLHNLRTILDLVLDAEGEWKTKLPEMMFRKDAELFILHVEASYMAFCTPRRHGDEFILTNRCYNIFEGPVCEIPCAGRNDLPSELWLSFHDFAPISPRLMIVSRSNLLPDAVEDLDPKVKQGREKFLEVAAMRFPEPQNVKSILSDLPISRATNSYTRTVNGRLELVEGYLGRRQSNDRFCFQFWQISANHVETINSIFLDNIVRCESIVFGSRESFKRALEAYMTAPATNFKQVAIGEHGVRGGRVECLEKLAMVLKMLGSSCTPVRLETNENEVEPTLQYEDVFRLARNIFLRTILASVTGEFPPPQEDE